jgi:hypothetical protein
MSSIVASGGNSGEGPTPTPIDRWEHLLEQIADDVHHIRSLVTVAMMTGWLLFLAVVVRIIFD